MRFIERAAIGLSLILGTSLFFILAPVFWIQATTEAPRSAAPKNSWRKDLLLNYVGVAGCLRLRELNIINQRDANARQARLETLTHDTVALEVAIRDTMNGPRDVPLATQRANLAQLAAYRAASEELDQLMQPRGQRQVDETALVKLYQDASCTQLLSRHGLVPFPKCKGQSWPDVEVISLELELEVLADVEAMIAKQAKRRRWNQVALERARAELLRTEPHQAWIWRLETPMQDLQKAISQAQDNPELACAGLKRVNETIHSMYNGSAFYRTDMLELIEMLP